MKSKTLLASTLVIIATLLLSTLGANALTGIAKIGGVAVGGVGGVTKIGTVGIASIAGVGRSNSRTLLHFAQVSIGPSDNILYTTASQKEAYIEDFNTLTGKDISGWNHFIANWGDEFDWILSGANSLQPLLQDGTLNALALNWMPYTATDDQQTMKDIAAGLEDAYIAARAAECTAFGYPVYMRLGAEFNLWQTGAADWAANATDFIAAWQYVYDAFQAEGVTNVLWVWNPNCYDQGGAPNHWTDYYPGDAYVDWVGVDLYQDYDAEDPDAQISGVYDDYGSTKPVGVFEWGVNSLWWSGWNTTDTLRAAYMEAFFDAVESRPGIGLISYFYYDAFQFTAEAQPLTTAVYQDRIATFGESNPPEPNYYFRADFDHTLPPAFDQYDHWPFSEPVAYTNELGVWDWIHVYPADAYSGSMWLTPDPDIPTESCLKMILDRSGTRPLGGLQHSKLYEIQWNRAANYDHPSVMTDREAWYNFKIWLPADFAVAGWRLIWQIMRDAQAPPNYPGPHMELIFSTTNLQFDIKPDYVDGINYHVATVMTIASIPKEQWVQISVYVKQGTAWRSTDGTVKVYIDGVEKVNETDMQTHGKGDSPLVTWGIANYGSASEAQGQYILFKEVNVANYREATP